jgi:hypothetical protein
MNSETDMGDDMSDTSCTKKAKQDQNSCYGPLSQHMHTDMDSGHNSNKLPHYFVYSKRGESCHQACFRQGEARGQEWYCDNLGFYNMDMKTALNNGNEEEIYYDGADAKNKGRCSTPTGDLGPNGDGDNVSWSIPKQTGPSKAWSPYMRYDGRCVMTAARGAPKCYTYHVNSFRLCPCADYSDLLGFDPPQGTDYTVGSPDKMSQGDMPAGRGWYMVTTRSCDNFCGAGGLVCGEDQLDNFKGADMMRDLEAAFIAARDPADDTVICKQWDDRRALALNPSYRATGQTCYVTPAEEEPVPACNIMSRNENDWRWCFCEDSA